MAADLKKRLKDIVGSVVMHQNADVFPVEKVRVYGMEKYVRALKAEGIGFWVLLGFVFYLLSEEIMGMETRHNIVPPIIYEHTIRRYVVLCILCYIPINPRVRVRLRRRA